MDTTRKRVSFGSHGSMIETLIIDEMPDKTEERHFYQRNIIQEQSKIYNDTSNKDSKSENRVSFLEGKWPPSKTTNLQSVPPPPIIITPIRRSQSMESQDNPFLPDGDLSKEVEMMLKRSTISRTQIVIGSDGSEQPGSPDGVTEPLMEPTNVETVSAEPPITKEQSQPNDVANASPNEIKPKENGKVDDATSPQQVDVKLPPAEETPKDSANKGEPAPDATKPKKAKGKCCTIM